MTTTDYLRLLTNQHRERPRFLASVAAMVSPLVALANVMRGFPQDFDVDTAVGKQLDTIGLWVGRTRKVAVPLEGVFFTWDDLTTDGWDAGVWQGEFESPFTLNTLNDSQFRKVLYGKISANNWKGDVAGAYATLRAAFGANGTILILDNQDMTQTVLVNVGALTAVERALLFGGHVPIKPAGVRINFEDFTLPPWELFMFHGGAALDAEILMECGTGERVVLANDTWLTATAEVPFTAETTMDFTLNGTTFATLVWPAGGDAPVSPAVTLVGDWVDFTIMPTDVLRLVGGATADATGADIAISVVGTRLPTL